MLLNGSVIGSVEDLGAVYYNPARLGLIKNPAFVISADVYELNNYKIEDAIGSRADLNKSNFGGAPSLAAGSIKMKSNSKHSFAYAILLRSNNDFGINYNNENERDIMPSIAGNELVEGEVDLVNNSKDHWFGGSWAYAIKENLSVGTSVFVSKLSSSKGNIYNIRALDNNGDVSVYEYNRNYQIQSYGLLAKFGLAYTLDDWNLGLTITTPRILISGKGKYNFYNYFSFPPENEINDIYANSYQDDLDIKLKTPFSIGFGAGYMLSKKNIIHFSAEYFHRVKNFDVLKAEPHNMQSQPDSTINFSLIDGYKSILNIGMGGEWYLNENISLYGSISTDFNSSPKEVYSFVSQMPIASNMEFDADYLHIAVGTLVTIKGADFTLGATHTGGKSNYSQPVNLPLQNVNYDPIETDDSGTIKWSRWQFIISVSIPFFKDYVKKIEDKIGL
ncbi:OmpP1/FadL family transporter [Echinicola salinicaeni]|uniref:OmpP1/FadL family transporter n=1 Tax=Echinicola salinicaeni TaxID=2762757 RepID=UPI001E50103A|nr:outer membrane protein transport protein [Echinicola salinicaeni]